MSLIKIKNSKKRDEKQINIILGCLVLMFITSLPLFTDFLLAGTNLQYQLIRIETLKNGLQQFGLHMWAKPEWINPQGFSFAFFYGDTFLYIPALFRMLGISVQMSYRLFLILINVVTVLISYHVFRKMFRDEYTGLLGAALYCVSIYRIFLMYSEAEVGEVLALAFLPLVIYGLYLIFVDEDGEENRKTGIWGSKAFLYIALGATGILRSHVLSFGMMIFLILLVMILHMKKLGKGRVWAQIGLSAAAACLMNCGYLYTMMRYITSGQFVINPVSGQLIQEKGIQIAQLFMCFYQAGGSHEFGVNGVRDAAPVGIGFVMFVVILVFCYLLFVYSQEFDAKIKARGFKVLAIGAVSCVLGLLCFPWDSLSKLFGGMAAVISFMQSPWHFLQIALAAFTVLGCITFGMVKQKYPEYGKYYGAGLVALTCLSASYLAANMLFTYNFVRIKLTEEIGYADLAGTGVLCEWPSGIWYVLQILSIAAVAAGAAGILRRDKKTAAVQ